MRLKQSEIQRLEELKLAGINRFKQALYSKLGEDFELIIPKKQEYFVSGYAYFPLNPLAGVYRVVPHRNHWMMERNGAGRYIKEDMFSGGLITTDEEGNITQSHMSYLLPSQFSDEDWLEWEDYEDWIHEGFTPYDGYSWYYMGNNIEMFPEIPGYPSNWWEIAKESYKEFILYQEMLLTQYGEEVESIYNED